VCQVAHGQPLSNTDRASHASVSARSFLPNRLGSDIFQEEAAGSFIFTRPEKPAK
jgi:hypothetical protein